MPQYRIPFYKIRLIRENCLSKKQRQKDLARALGIRAETVRDYEKEFRELQRKFPRRKTLLDYVVPRPEFYLPPTDRYVALMAALPELVEKFYGPRLNAEVLYEEFSAIYPQYHYCKQHFVKIFTEWREDHGISVYHHLRIRHLEPNDEQVLREWRRSNVLDKWQRAVVLLGSRRGASAEELALKIEKTVKTVLKWIDSYKRTGLKEMPRKQPADLQPSTKRKIEKKDLVIRLLHESPTLHGYNRTTWRAKDLAETITRIYGIPIYPSTITEYIRESGFVYKRAKEVLTSPDPDFSSKVGRIQQILNRLGPAEKFFSIDEFGPKAIRRKMAEHWWLKKLPE